MNPMSLQQRFSKKPSNHLPASGLHRSERWAVILAGGDGTRLQSMTRTITGDDRPKQFVPVIGGSTLLDQTRSRVALSVSPGRTLFVVTEKHRRFYQSLTQSVSQNLLLEQPANKGTTPAILYALLRVAAKSPKAPSSAATRASSTQRARASPGPSNGRSETKIDRLSRYWGDDSWRTEAYTTSGNLFGFEEKTSNEALAAAFRERLRSVAGFEYVPTPMPMKNTRGAVVYYLYFASQKPVASKIVKALFDKHRHRTN